MAKRILVADDNALIRRMLCELFEREEDYDICAEATNGQEAIDLALKHRPDLIILDWAMPAGEWARGSARTEKDNARCSDNFIQSACQCSASYRNER